MELYIKYDTSKKGNDYVALYTRLYNGQYTLISFDKKIIDKVCSIETQYNAYINKGAYVKL